MSTASDIEVWNRIKITAYACNAPPLAIWLCILVRLLVTKEIRELMPLIVVSVLMIVDLVSSMAYWQFQYNQHEKRIKGDLNHPVIANQILEACGFTSDISFYIAHWVFAFSYLCLSYRFELIKKNLNEISYNRRLNIVNAIVCVIIVAMTAVIWVLDTENKYNAEDYTYDIM